MRGNEMVQAGNRDDDAAASLAIQRPEQVRQVV
jgi:hypothetical protein